MEGTGKVTTQRVVEYFEKQNIEISLEDAELILEYFKDLVDHILSSYMMEVKNKQ